MNDSEPLISRNKTSGRSNQQHKMENSSTNIKISRFYDEYYGHKIEQLQFVADFFRQTKKNEQQAEGAAIIFLAGDSSLDNKHWFQDTAPAVNGYEKILQPPVSKQDVCYWMNVELVKRGLGPSMTCVNAALEESSIGSRACGRLLAHDKFIRNNLNSDDILVVSVGGNDIALKPNLCTILNILVLLKCIPTSCIQNRCHICVAPCDDCCCGCGPSCMSNCCSFPFGYGYFLHLFRIRVKSYLANLIGSARPKKILVCMIYFPDEKPSNSWADFALNALGYDSNPEKLQLMIRSVFEDATKKIDLGTDIEMVGVPLYAALNGKHSTDYCERAEPSAKGGEKMAKLIMDAVTGGNQAMSLTETMMER